MERIPPKTITKEDKMLELRDIQLQINEVQKDLELLNKKREDVQSNLLDRELDHKKVFINIDKNLNEKKQELKNLSKTITDQRFEFNSNKIKLKTFKDDIVKKLIIISKLEGNKISIDKDLIEISKDLLKVQTTYKEDMTKMISDKKEIELEIKISQQKSDKIKNENKNTLIKRKEIEIHLSSREHYLKQKEQDLNVYERRLKRVYNKLYPEVKFKTNI